MKYLDLVLGLEYHNEMIVPSKKLTEPDAVTKGPRARTRRLMVMTASQMMQRGGSPSVSEVAEVAEVSRSTAYRYFPTQSAMVQAVVVEALGPILSWEPSKTDPEELIASLFESSFPRILANEAIFRAALRQSLEAGGDALQDGEDGSFGRGHRVDLLMRALSGLADVLSDAQRTRLAQALSLAFGIESAVVLKDIWGLNNGGVQSVTLWAARAMIRAALAEISENDVVR
ncbi:TetR/AcrR family transcriptional regulator [Parasedimentitalea psychrophila]|uniref:TetR/AcrR family transcriptional regulator n=1 Tax=Parasedimentitalea psychrophila TaxID=2997337 RepID=A0A9Y2P1M2_9RHOB|nr:TetR/AcrR family transcriptional regulator [Parasedimentitalea psychrophila]WIY25741.1 TetR/AcrR family transcriptional regulator [Parasedimentitalea psychrophila]